VGLRLATDLHERTKPAGTARTRWTWPGWKTASCWPWSRTAREEPLMR
jgi:hypothetical protein